MCPESQTSNFVLALLLISVCAVIDKVPDQRLWHRRGRTCNIWSPGCTLPNQRQLERSLNDHAGQFRLATSIRNLRAFASLGVFAHNAVNVLVVDVGKVLQHGIYNGNLAQVGAATSHHHRVSVRAVRKSGIVIGNARAIVLAIKRLHRREGPAWSQVHPNANNRVVRASMCQS